MASKKSKSDESPSSVLFDPDRPIESITADRLSEVPDLMSFLYRWKQSGGEGAMKRWTSKQTKDDTQLVDLLEKCRGWRLTDRVHHPLNKRDISIFIDFDSMKGRLEAISSDKSASPEIRAKSRELIAAAKLGEKDFNDE